MKILPLKAFPTRSQNLHPNLCQPHESNSIEQVVSLVAGQGGDAKKICRLNITVA